MTAKKTEKPADTSIDGQKLVRVIDREMALYDLISAQAACDPVKKFNQGHNYKYADLKTLFDACKEALHNHHFAVLQTNGHDQFGQYVMTSLIHVSGEKFQSVVYLDFTNSRLNGMQGLGSAITYARRYGLMGLCAVAPEDDDGKAASQPAVSMSSTPPQKPTPRSVPVPIGDF
jgi:hypothetical protein